MPTKKKTRENKRRYPWDDWLNGDVWEIHRDRAVILDKVTGKVVRKTNRIIQFTGQFGMPTELFRKMLHVVAARKHLVVETSVSGDRIRFQFSRGKKWKPLKPKPKPPMMHPGINITQQDMSEAEAAKSQADPEFNRASEDISLRHEGNGD